MTLLFVVWSSVGQVIPILTCQKHGDCKIGEYCDNTFSCSICNYVTPETCDAIRVECCTDEFLRHCPSDPHKCPAKPVETQTNQGLYMFNVIFFITTISYLIVGSYINKYQKGKQGLYILPNYNSWVGLKGLVQDGIHFTQIKIGNRIPYDSLE